jgi:hypothetical protein
MMAKALGNPRAFSFKLYSVMVKVASPVQPGMSDKLRFVTSKTSMNGSHDGLSEGRYGNVAAPPSTTSTNSHSGIVGLQ